MNVLDYGRRGTERAESCPSNFHRKFQARGRCEIGKWRLNCVTLYPDESVQCVVWQLGRHEERGSVVPGIEGIACNRNPRSCMLSMRAGPVGQLTLRDILTLLTYQSASPHVLKSRGAYRTESGPFQVLRHLPPPVASGSSLIRVEL